MSIRCRTRPSRGGGPVQAPPTDAARRVRLLVVQHTVSGTFHLEPVRVSRGGQRALLSTASGRDCEIEPPTCCGELWRCPALRRGGERLRITHAPSGTISR